MSRKQFVSLGIAVAVLPAVLLLVGRRHRLNGWRLVNVPPRSGSIVCFGDSLVAGVGADSPDAAYPAQLGKILGRKVYAFGFPGFTAEQGWKELTRIQNAHAAVVIVTLGGNDIIQQVAPETTCKYLGKIFTELQQSDATVVFTEVSGLFSSNRSRQYRALCRKRGVAIVPDVLKGVLADPGLKADQVHPNADGYRLMAERVARVLQSLNLVPPPLHPTS